MEKILKKNEVLILIIILVLGCISLDAFCAKGNHNLFPNITKKK